VDVQPSKYAFEATQFAAGSVRKAMLHVLEQQKHGHILNAFVAIRPPGHHATHTKGPASSTT